MNEKRFRANFDVSIYDSEKEEYISASERGLEEIAKIMNEQQATITNLQGDVERLKYIIEELRKDNYKRFEKINELQAKLQEKEEDEKLYANEIVELRKTNEEWLQFKELGGDY